MPHPHNIPEITLCENDPLLKEAASLLVKLSQQGVTVFHNPTFGIMLSGSAPQSPVPARILMDEAYALHNEIAMLFALQSFKQNQKALVQYQQSLDKIYALAGLAKDNSR